LGVEIGDDVAKEPHCYDLGAREIICLSFRTEGEGKHMQSAHMWAIGRNGKLLEMTVKDPKVEVISEEYSYLKELITPAMTRFENSLGGKVVILGQTLDGNYSQSIFNYRRKRLFENLLLWCGDKYPFVREEANVFTIVNESCDEEAKDFKGIITLINLGADTCEKLTIHLPEKWKEVKDVLILDPEGKWKKEEYKYKNQELLIKARFEYCEPQYVMIK